MASLALAFDILAKDKASPAFTSAGRSADTFNSKLSGMGSRFAALGKVAAVGLGAAGVAMAAFGKTAISAGSDLAETVSKSNTVFGDQAAVMNTWANTAAESFGQTRKQALDAAASFGNMFIQLGIGRKQAAQMSKSMTELASDFASFHNADITEVLTAQAAAFRGEYDAVQRFVPTINAAAVEEKALQLGLAKTTKELTAQDKALATQTLLLEGAGDAMGDFDRTSEGLANKQRILTARFGDLQAKIGQALIPIALSLAEVFSERVLPVFDEVGGAVSAFVAAFRSGSDDITSSGFAGFIEGLGVKARKFADVAVPAIKGFVSDALTALSNWWRSNGDSILGFFSELARIMKDDVAPVLANVARIVKDDVMPALNSFAGWIVENEHTLIGFKVFIGTAMVAAFAAYTASALAASAATLAAIAPFVALAAVAAAGTAVIVWATERFEWFAKAQLLVGAGAMMLVSAFGRVVDIIKTVIHYAKEAVKLLGSIKIPSLPGMPGSGGALPFLGPLDPTAGIPFVPFFANGGVMPGRRGVHSLAMVAGGETVLPTHKPGFGGGFDAVGEDQLLELRRNNQLLDEQNGILRSMVGGNITRSRSTAAVMG